MDGVVGLDAAIADNIETIYVINSEVQYYLAILNDESLLLDNIFGVCDKCFLDLYSDCVRSRSDRPVN